jgi:rhodanese-related sulfurtransferase
MSRMAIAVVTICIALGLGAGFGAGWSTAPRTIVRPAVQAQEETARSEELRSVTQALDGWVRESATFNYQRISTIELRAATREDDPEGGPVYLIDVRDHVDWLDKHIPGAVNVPLTALTALPGKLPADKSTNIVTYCGDGHRGALAVAALRTLGYTHVRTLTGGLTAWAADGYPITSYQY